MSHKYKIGDKVIIKATQGVIGTVYNVNSIHRGSIMIKWDFDPFVTFYPDAPKFELYNQTPVHGESPVELPKPKEKEIDPADCKLHNWVTTTMFRFDTTCCKKCGVKRDE